MAELQIKAQDAQRKAAKDQAEIELKAERLKLDQEKMASSERIAGAKIMAEVQLRDSEAERKQMAEVVKASTKLMGGA